MNPAKPEGVLVVIPARYGSSRFPGKALADIAGRPLIVRVAENARGVRLADRVIVATDDARIADLNAEYRGKPKPTNILSWPAFEGPPPAPEQDEPAFLGDLAIAYDTCAAEAAAAGIPLGDHVSHLVVHGVLHLLGYDHEMEDEADAMEAFETKILASMGLPNPYSN